MIWSLDAITTFYLIIVSRSKFMKQGIFRDEQIFIISVIKPSLDLIVVSISFNGLQFTHVFLMSDDRDGGQDKQNHFSSC